MTLPPVPRLDVHEYLPDLPVPLTYEGPCPGGQVGAAYVRWPDGHRSVLTRGPDVSGLLATARAAGIPAPRYELVHPPIVVQELLPGIVAREPTAAIVESMLETPTSTCSRSASTSPTAPPACAWTSPTRWPRSAGRT